MSNLKNPKNRKLLKLKFLWCLIAFLVAFPAIFVAQCSDGTQKCAITLPSLQNGIEKIEYTLNGEAQGSVDGKKTIEAEPGSRLNFSVKFESKGYSQNRVRNVGIISETNKALKLNTYSYDETEGFLLMKVPDDELINPDQIYISSDYTVKSDDNLAITGIESDKYTAKIRAENADVDLQNAIDLKYTTDGIQYLSAVFSAENNLYIIDNLTYESDVELNIIQKTGYDDSTISLYCNTSKIVLNQSTKTCALPNLTDDLEITIKNLEKNSYTVFSPENALFKFKIKDQDTDFNYQSSIIAQYGDTIEFMCDEKDEKETSAITANGTAIAKSNDVYTIENINQNYDIQITPKDTALYPITLAKTETRVAIADETGTKSDTLYASYGSELDFKVIPNEKYQKNFIASQVYAIPTSKLSNDTYDFETNSEEAKSFLVVPSADKIYSLTNIAEPITLIVDNLTPSICSVFLPQSVIGANVSVVNEGNIEQVSENQFNIPYGSDFTIEITATNGYDISSLNVCDFDNVLEIEQTDNRYTFKHVTNDSYLIINGAKKSSCTVTFSGEGVTATDLNGHAWLNNTAVITDDIGELKFKVKPAENCTVSDSGLSLDIKSGGGQLTKVTDATNEYILTNVTENIVLETDGIICPNVTIKLIPPNEDIKFTSIDDETAVLPEETVVPYGTDLTFRVVSASGRSVDNLELASSNGAEMVQSDTLSDVYSVSATSDLIVYSTESESTAKTDIRNIIINLIMFKSETTVVTPDGKETTFNMTNFTPDGWSEEETWTQIGHCNWCEKPYIIFSEDEKCTKVLNNDLSPALHIPFNKEHNEDGSTYLVQYAPDSGIKFKPESSSTEYPVTNPQVGVYFGFSQNATLSSGDLNKDTKTNLSLRGLEFTGQYTNDNAETQKILLKAYNGVTYNKLGSLHADSTNYTPSGMVLSFGDSNTISPLLDRRNIYCNIFTDAYEAVTVINKLTTLNDDNSSDKYKIDPLPGTETTSGCLHNIEDTNNYQVQIQKTDSGAYAVTTTKFTVKLNPGLVFNTNDSGTLSTDTNGTKLCPLELKANHATLEQKLIDETTLECTLTVTPFDETIELGWANQPKTDTRGVKFSGEGTVIETEIEKNGTSVVTTTNATNVGKHGGLTFYSSPRAGYQYYDTLTITNGNTNSDTFDLKLLNTITTTDISGTSETTTTSDEWFKLSGTGLYLKWRPNDTGNKVIYEIASKQTKIERYYEYQESTNTWQLTTLTDPLTPNGITEHIQINSKRNIYTYNINFEYAEGIKYVLTTDNVATVNYGDSYAFDVEALDGYDVSNIQVLSTVPGKTSIIPYMNNLYILTNITENITISVTNIEKTSVPLVFNQYDGVSYKNISEDYYVYRQNVPYHTEIAFQLEVDPKYSLSSNALTVEANLGGERGTKSFVDILENSSENENPYKKGNLYVIPAELVDDQITVSINGLEINSYEIKLHATETDKQKFSYYDQYGQNLLKFDVDSNQTNKNLVNYGDSFSFQIKANDDSYDLSSIQVIASDGTRSETLIPADGVYTIADVTTGYTVTVSGISKVTHTVEFRTVDGVTCLDKYGDNMDKKLTVTDGDSVIFYLSFDTAYNQSKNNADLVQVKGSGSLSPDKTDGKYVLPTVTSDTIVEIINVTKNTYTANFVPAEGVVYKTAKGKEFEGTLQVEYGDTLYFKISLLDAYDQSFPNVKMNETENLVENSGSYCLENISNDIRVTVENVEKNPEEVTIDSIMKVPETVVSESDVDAVIAATNAYNSLTDEEKELVRNKHELESAQRNSGDINHTAGDITITGVDWNIKLVVKDLSNDSEQMDAMQSDVDRRELLSLYDIDLIDTLTGEEYEIPYGISAQLTMPTPNLIGYKNNVVVHKNDVDNIEYIDVNIVDDTAKLEISSTGLFGIAAKKIPNYSENVSDVSISVSSLVEDEDELKTLLGENLSSELGHLIDLDDITSSSGDSQSGARNHRRETIDESLAENEDSLSSSLSSAVNSLGEDISGSAENIYNWALDNEFWAVLIILIVGSALIGIILISNRKKEESDKK